MLEARNIELILVQMPVTRAAFELYKNNEFVDSLFTSQGAYYNLNRTLEMDDDMDFIDYHHLNQSGVVKANTVLVGLLNDRRALENSHG